MHLTGTGLTQVLGVMGFTIRRANAHRPRVIIGAAPAGDPGGSADLGRPYVTWDSEHEEGQKRSLGERSVPS
jgi:hypothetical protein